jgi:diaminopimelate epimerase
MSLLKQFVKYQSLGNHFILFDWLKKPAVFVEAELSGDSFSAFVQQVCNPHYGVGADGVLILVNHAQAGCPEMIIYNADGSKAEMCLNGLRCVAHHLAVAHNFPTSFGVQIGNRVVTCTVVSKELLSGQITMQIGSFSIDGVEKITTDAGVFVGTKASIGNPHFFVFQKTTLDWLRLHGKQIESHVAFPCKTNVEFVWEGELYQPEAVIRSFNMLVYERGCGITLACSSGAGALIGLLNTQGLAQQDEKIAIIMPGGAVIAWVDNQSAIYLQASAQRVFTGVLSE